MPNKSGTSEQIISLPKGGGALQGIGESFSPDLFTGTGNFSVPITIPPGRNGFQPDLSLVYSTGNGNGPFGLGWNLSIPGVDRKTEKGIPQYQGDDTFLLSGAEDLIPVNTDITDAGVTYTEYRPRTEGLFAVIRRYRDPANDYWEVKSKDGLVSIYGTPDAIDNDPATIFDPEQPRHIFSWKLTETRDPFGNRIVYEYARDRQQTENRHWNQLYLRRVRYIDYTDSAGNEEFLAEVRFIYENDRKDAFSVYRSGFEIRTNRICRQIEVYTHPGRELLVRSYDLQYEYADYSHVALLRQVEVSGHDPDKNESESLPPLQFSYSSFQPENKDFYPVEGSDMPMHSLGRPDTDLIDLFGNGLPDIIQMNGTVRYWKNLGNGRFDLPRPMSDAPAGVTLADPAVQFFDADGEGKADLVVSRPGLSGYFPTLFDALWDPQSFKPYRSAPSFNLFDPDVKLVDLDGDGVTDALRSGNQFECYFNQPGKGWDENNTKRINRRRLEEFPNVNFSDPRVRLADMTGDNLQDILMIHDGNVEYWPYMGHGKWGKRIHMRNSPRFPAGYNPSQILIGDIVGDGAADIVFVDHCEVTLWINQNGNGFSEPVTISGTPPITDMDSIRLVDLNGTGVAGILWSSDQQASHRAHYYFLDVTDGSKPYLLHEMDNNMGAVTKVRYRPSTYYYNRDAIRPETRWQSPLPFPIQVVACVEVIDKISQGKLTTEYSYHHGYWDGADREFRGFGRVEQVDTQTFAQFNSQGLHGDEAFNAVEARHYTPPLLTKTWFHQGPVGPGQGAWTVPDYSQEYWSEDVSILPTFSNQDHFLRQLPNRKARRDALRTLRGSVIRTELYALDNSPRRDRPYTVSESAYSLRNIQPPDQRNVPGSSHLIFFPHQVASGTTQWERGNDPMTQFTFIRNYDDYGQATEQISIACPRGWRALADAFAEVSPFLSVYSTTVFARTSAPDVYIKNRVVQTTSYEIEHRGNQNLLDILAATTNAARLQLMGQTLTYYDGPAFLGASYGAIEQYGAPVRTETLVLTEELIQAAYTTGGIPTYLLSSVANPNWTPDYPAGFQQNFPQWAGYRFYDGTGEQARGFFVATSRIQYDFHDNSNPHHMGLPMVNRDALGRDTHIVYEDYYFLPKTVTTPYRLTTEVKEYDYRIFQPNLVVDPNGNQTAFAFNSLGLLTATAVMGKEGEDLGDTLQDPGTRLEYDFHAFVRAEDPISVRSIVREHHVHDSHNDSEEERNRTIQTVDYSDGFGRLIQTRTQAEEVHFEDQLGLPVDQANGRTPAIGQRHTGAAPRVVVSGWQVYDNKGQVVLKYEPFFDEGWNFNSPQDEQLGQAVELFYDPRGQVIRTLNPDGSEQRVIYGVPGDTLVFTEKSLIDDGSLLHTFRQAVPLTLNDPDSFVPTPWEAYTYDENDLAPISAYPEGQSLADQVPNGHHFTPSSILIDGLGRTVIAIERNRVHNATVNDPVEEYQTISHYDIRNNLILIQDALGRTAFQYTFDLANQNIRTESIDAGWSYQVQDALGNPIETRDEKGAIMLSAFDALNRPVRMWARDGTGQPMSLRQMLIYAESTESGLTAAAARRENKRGKLLLHYDEAGLVSFKEYDFKGNLREKSRQVISDAVIRSRLNFQPPDYRIQAFQIDWEPPNGLDLADHAASLLATQEYTTTSHFDALNRIRELHYPEDVEGERKTLRPIYNRAGALQSLTLDESVYVERIAYNAKGQRRFIAYGNGIMTRYAYDPQTFRLARLRSEGYRLPAELIYRPSGNVLQDFAYTYDLVGNITTIQDRTPGSGILTRPDELDRTFQYDALYRLTYASGREHDRDRAAYPWEEASTHQDINLNRPYWETYQYDPMGNLLELAHRYQLPQQNNVERGFTRTFTHQTQNNRLRHLTIRDRDYSPVRYQYDAAGNMIREMTNRHFEWNHSNELKVFRNQAENAAPTCFAHYQYDAGGQRTQKVIWKQGGQVCITIYIDGLFEHHRIINAGVTEQNNSLHILDDQQRIALVRAGAPIDRDTTPAVKYHLGDHLGSSNVVVGDNGRLINREEYTPYGESSFGTFAKKRYRYSGKERDEESGLYYYGARYYGAWLGKWVSSDSIAETDNINLYLFVNNNPLNYYDPNGKAAFLALAIPLVLEGGATIAFLKSAFLVSSAAVIGLGGAYTYDKVTQKVKSDTNVPPVLPLNPTNSGQNNSKDFTKGSQNRPSPDLLIKATVVTGLSLATLKITATETEVRKRKKQGHLHHIATNKDDYYHIKFAEIFSKANPVGTSPERRLTVDSPENKTYVKGHKGPHPIEYHEAVLKRLEIAVQGIEPNTAEYRKALVEELQILALEINTPGTKYNYWVRHPRKYSPSDVHKKDVNSKDPSQIDRELEEISDPRSGWLPNPDIKVN